MAKISPLQFFRQVKQEVKKVTWPTRKEVTQNVIMVLFIVTLAATFFFIVDQILRNFKNIHIVYKFTSFF